MNLSSHCKRGHLYTPENIYLRPDDGSRQCRTCKKEDLRDWRAKNPKRSLELDRKWRERNSLQKRAHRRKATAARRARRISQTGIVSSQPRGTA